MRYLQSGRLDQFSYRIARKWYKSANQVAKDGKDPELLSVLLRDPECVAGFIYDYEHEEAGKGGLRIRRKDLKVIEQGAKDHALAILEENRDCDLGFLIVRLKLMKERANSPRAVRARELREKQEKVRKRYRVCELRRSRNILGERMTDGMLKRLKAGVTDREVAVIRGEILKELAA